MLPNNRLLPLPRHLSQPHRRKLWLPVLDIHNSQGTLLAVEALPSGLILTLPQPYPRRLFLPGVGLYDVYVNRLGLLLVVPAGPPAGSLLLMGVGI